MAHEGKSIGRLKQNPRERVFHDAWKHEQELGGHVLEYILGDNNQRAVLTDRDELVAATVIQWLGSPVGQFFLAETQARADQVMLEDVVSCLGR